MIQLIKGSYRKTEKYFLPRPVVSIGHWFQTERGRFWIGHKEEFVYNESDEALEEGKWWMTHHWKCSKLGWIELCTT